jgi:hypothetical protein
MASQFLPNDQRTGMLQVQWALQDSNLRPTDYESAALTD